MVSCLCQAPLSKLEQRRRIGMNIGCFSAMLRGCTPAKAMKEAQNPDGPSHKRVLVSESNDLSIIYEVVESANSVGCCIREDNEDQRPSGSSLLLRSSTHEANIPYMVRADELFYFQVCASDFTSSAPSSGISTNPSLREVYLPVSEQVNNHAASAVRDTAIVCLDEKPNSMSSIEYFASPQAQVNSVSRREIRDSIALFDTIMADVLQKKNSTPQVLCVASQSQKCNIFPLPGIRKLNTEVSLREFAAAVNTSVERRCTTAQAGIDDAEIIERLGDNMATLVFRDTWFNQSQESNVRTKFESDDSYSHIKPGSQNPVVVRDTLCQVPSIEQLHGLSVGSSDTEKLLSAATASSNVHARAQMSVIELAGPANDTIPRGICSSEAVNVLQPQLITGLNTRCISCGTESASTTFQEFVKAELGWTRATDMADQHCALADAIPTCSTCLYELVSISEDKASAKYDCTSTLGLCLSHYLDQAVRLQREQVPCTESANVEQAMSTEHELEHAYVSMFGSKALSCVSYNNMMLRTGTDGRQSIFDLRDLVQFLLQELIDTVVGSPTELCRDNT